MKTKTPKFHEGDIVKFARRDDGSFRVDGNVADAMGRVHVALSAILDGGQFKGAGCVPQVMLVKVGVMP